jgi:hypothetical protein
MFEFLPNPAAEAEERPAGSEKKEKAHVHHIVCSQTQIKATPSQTQKRARK